MSKKIQKIDPSDGVQYVGLIQSDEIAEGATPYRREVEFDETDFAAGSKTIGVAKSGMRVERVSLIIDEAFDGGAQITIGDVSAQGRFVASLGATASIISTYTTFPDYSYASDTDVKLFFPAGTPTTGHGLAILYIT